MKESDEILIRFEVQANHAPGVEGLKAAIDRNFKDLVRARFEEMVLGDLTQFPSNCKGILSVLDMKVDDD